MICAVCHDEGELAVLGEPPVVLAPCSVVSARVRALLAMDPIRRMRTIAGAMVDGPDHMTWARDALREGMRRITCECRRYTITVAGEPVRDEEPLE